MLNAFYDVGVIPQAIEPAADNEDITGAGVDMQGYQGGVMFIAYAEGGEALDFSLAVEAGDKSDFSDATDLIDPDTGVAAAATFSTTADPLDGHACLEGIRPRQRYLRPVLTVPNANTAKAVAIIAILTDPYHAPVDNEGIALVSPNRQ